METKKIKIEVENGEFPGIYKITDKQTGEPYIGVTKLTINERLTQHCNSPEAKNGIDYAINKKGYKNFTFETLVPMYEPDQEQLWFLEQFFIHQYDSKNNGYNLTKGNHVEKFAEFAKRYNKDFFSVPVPMFKQIENVYNINFKNEKVLLIGRYDREIIDHLKWCAKEVYQIYKATDDKDELGNYMLEDTDNYMDKENLIIISNPPYGKIGAEITKKIIDTIDYKQFVNLLPVNDYKRVAGLWNHCDISTYKMCDFYKYNVAGVTSAVFDIKKGLINDLDFEEFKIECYNYGKLDILKRYFYLNKEKYHYAISNLPSTGFIIKNAGVWDPENTFIFHNRDMNHGYMGSENSITYKWNINKSLVFDDIICRKDQSEDKQLTFCNINFKTKEEKNNFCDFIYGYSKFNNLLWSIVDPDMGIQSIALPKVDWTKAWTPEEILKEYGYTKKEIKVIMDEINSEN